VSHAPDRNRTKSQKGEKRLERERGEDKTSIFQGIADQGEKKTTVMENWKNFLSGGWRQLREKKKRGFWVEGVVT